MFEWDAETRKKNWDRFNDAKTKTEIHEAMMPFVDRALREEREGKADVGWAFLLGMVLGKLRAEEAQ